MLGGNWLGQNFFRQSTKIACLTKEYLIFFSVIFHKGIKPINLRGYYGSDAHDKCQVLGRRYKPCGVIEDDEKSLTGGWITLLKYIKRAF